MAQKDIAERNLENINAIFADIVNVFFAVNGLEDRIDPADLREAAARTSYRKNSALRGQERDVVKYWVLPDIDAIVCLIGMENQSGIDTYMSLRLAGYEGADYRAQVPPRRKKGARYRARKPHYVLSIVLYFGTRRRWPKRRSLQDRVGVPGRLRPFTMGMPVNVLELAFLTEEEEALFKSDFRHVVHYLRQERMGVEHFDMLPGEIEHAQELLDVLYALTGDRRFKDAVAQAVEMQKKGEPIKLRSFLEEAEMRGFEKGRHEMRSFLEQAETRGRSEGRIEGRRAMMNKLITEKGWDPREAASFAGLSL